MNAQQIDFYLISIAFRKEHPVILWLDDERDPYGKCHGYPYMTWVEYTIGKTNYGNWEVVWVKNYTEFVKYIDTAGIPDVVCFDHDLGKQKNGKDCANYLMGILMDRNSLGPAVRSQSYNPVGAANILNLFNGWHDEWLKRNPNKNIIKQLIPWEISSNASSNANNGFPSI